MSATLRLLFANTEVRIDKPVKLSLTVAELKKLIFEQWPEGVKSVERASELRLIHGGRRLNDALSLAEQSIAPSSTSAILVGRPPPPRSVSAKSTGKPGNAACFCCLIL